MNTQRAFELMHTPSSETTDEERRTWVEATWSLRSDRREQLAELRE